MKESGTVQEAPPYVSRLQALRSKHAILSAKIERAQKTPSTAEFYIKQLKKQKLLLKDEIESMDDKELKKAS